MFALSFLILLILVGTGGYMLLVPQHITILESLYMTVITIATVGYGEIFQIDNNPPARVFTMFLIILGMWNTAFVVASFTELLVGGEVAHFFRRLRTMSNIKRFNSHFIVCGAGTTGGHLIKELYDTKRQFVVIEHNPAAANALAERFPGITLIEGDALQDYPLQEAGIEKASNIACVLSNDKDNLFLCVTAKQLNPNIRIISKIIELGNREKMLRAGASSLVSPNFIGAMRIASELIRPTVVTFLDVMLRDQKNIRVEEIQISENSWIVNRTLHDLQLPQKIGIHAIALQNAKTQEFNYCPLGVNHLDAHDTLIVIGDPEQILEARAYINQN